MVVFMLSNSMANLKCNFKLFRDAKWKVGRSNLGRYPLFADPCFR